jgi:hypothetical protein
MPGSRNDINIMNASPLFQSIRACTYPPSRPATTIEGLSISWFYFLVDSIYLRYRIILTTYTRPPNKKEKLFASVQEGVRKAVERVFAVLFSRWHIVYRPARGRHVEELVDIIATCCILHNMLIADREELGDGRTIGTRNIVSFGEAAPPSDMVIFAPAETREAQAMHWRETADLVENKEQHFLSQKRKPLSSGTSMAPVTMMSKVVCSPYHVSSIYRRLCQHSTFHVAVRLRRTKPGSNILSKT